MTRLTRKESQAQTRQCLLRSAARIFASRGLQQASIDEVAEDAGFTRGAFYANFASKQELFLAMLDRRFAARLEEVERVIAGDQPGEQKAVRAGEGFGQMLAADREWQRLFLEFSAYAARNEPFREELVTRYRWLRERIAAALRARAQAEGLDVGVPAQQVAMMRCVMTNGFALEKLLDPDMTPDELLGTMLTVFFAGLHALAPQAPGTSR